MSVGTPVAAPPLVRHYRVWRTDFRVEAPAPAILAALDRVCAQFQAAPSDRAIEMAARPAADGGWRVGRDGEPGVPRQTAEGAARHLEWRMVGIAARAEQDLIHWHAAALRRGPHTVLLPARSGAGKSTLAVALALDGFELLGEDIVFMDPVTFTIHPFARSIRLDRRSRERLQAPGYELNGRDRVGSLIPSAAIPSWGQAASPLTHVLLVDWDEEDGPVEIVPVTQAETAIELRPRSHNLRRDRDGGWPLLREMLARTRCYRVLRSQDLRAASEGIARLVDAEAP